MKLGEQAYYIANDRIQSSLITGMIEQPLADGKTETIYQLTGDVRLSDKTIFPSIRDLFVDMKKRYLEGVMS